MALPALETTGALPGYPWIQKHQSPFILEDIIAVSIDLLSACHVPDNKQGALLYAI